MKVLALDLGTKTGWAFGDTAAAPSAGTWTLATASQIRLWGKNRLRRRLDPRVILLLQKVGDVMHGGSFTPPDVVIFEDVQFASSTYQVQLWASLRAAVWIACYNNGVPLVDCVPTGTLKLFAAGHGGATKPMMEAALYRKYPEYRKFGCDDNGVDAIWLWHWARERIRR
jgi:Holliday junction resolvasome RuvABC endonuclease subunit